jgi:two-component system OmpR family sensor kinase
MIRGGSIRHRMMLLFCAVVGALLALSYAGFYLMFQRVVSDQLDRRLRETAAPIIADLMIDPEESDVDALDITDEYFEVLNSSGKVLQRSKNLENSLPLSMDWISPKNLVYRTVQTPREGEIRVAVIPFDLKGETNFFAVSTSTREAVLAMERLRNFALILFPASLMLTAAISRVYANRSLRPVAELTRQADRMSRRLSHSSPDPKSPGSGGEDELRLLAKTFDKLFDSLDSAVGQLRQFVSDASHELRTPLSVLRGETELLLARQRSTTEYESAVRIIDAELKKLSHIVDGLFTLSMADAGQLRLETEPLYLEEVLEETCAMAAPAARQKQIRIEKNLQRDVCYSGDAAFLRQLFLIFIDNALKYSPSGTRLRVKLSAERDIVIRFQDEGIGIAHDHIPRVFERFFRVAQNGSGETQSGGLGLAIAQAIVQAHQGTIECESELGAGSVFTIRLPLASSAST